MSWSFKANDHANTVQPCTSKFICRLLDWKTNIVLCSTVTSAGILKHHNTQLLSGITQTWWISTVGPSVFKKIIKIDLITLQLYIKDLKTSVAPLWFVIEKDFRDKKEKILNQQKTKITWEGLKINGQALSQLWWSWPSKGAFKAHQDMAKAADEASLPVWISWHFKSDCCLATT